MIFKQCIAVLLLGSCMQSMNIQRNPVIRLKFVRLNLRGGSFTIPANLCNYTTDDCARLVRGVGNFAPAILGPPISQFANDFQTVYCSAFVGIMYAVNEHSTQPSN
mmetsp:Transcript_31306/g.83963  ORF Transcript_31306/g.83963 Transcript_31306/m.83963 type:complete len:106 (-) Transcript_31306:131-448(-)